MRGEPGAERPVARRGDAHREERLRGLRPPALQAAGVEHEAHPARQAIRAGCCRCAPRRTRPAAGRLRGDRRARAGGRHRCQRSAGAVIARRLVEDWRRSDRAPHGRRAPPAVAAPAASAGSDDRRIIRSAATGSTTTSWAYLGNHGWGWDDVLPLFRRSEDFDGGAPSCTAGRPLARAVALRARSAARVDHRGRRSPPGSRAPSDHNGRSGSKASARTLRASARRGTTAAAAFLRRRWPGIPPHGATGTRALRLLSDRGGRRCVGRRRSAHDGVGSRRYTRRRRSCYPPAPSGRRGSHAVGIATPARPRPPRRHRRRRACSRSGPGTARTTSLVPVILERRARRAASRPARAMQSQLFLARPSRPRARRRQLRWLALEQCPSTTTGRAHRARRLPSRSAPGSPAREAARSARAVRTEPR